ncbi:2-hydroxychromene-2-carboxylate isomerase [Nocardia sp. NPDC059177]|uniref:2-hydroxychromene-2-carboxylate isomerase n=1 Tax=Nocardia sp. NPDC059177 TaxID=3346759 RepID=UPI0036BD9818
MTRRSRTKPRLYFSFRSPYTWLAAHRLIGKVPAAFDLIDFIPSWEPDDDLADQLEQAGGAVPYQPMSKAKHLYILQDTKRIASSLGLTMRWPVDIDPWWELPHLAWLAADRDGRGAEMFWAIANARWLRGENICDPEVITRCAVEASVDPEFVVAAARDSAIRAEGVRLLAQADDDDVFGFPYFRAGWLRFWGYDRVDDFVSSLRDGSPAVEVRLDDLPPEVLSEPGCYDTDAPGGCG